MTAARLNRVLAARRGEDWIDRLCDYYREPWIKGDPEDRLAAMLLDLRAAKVDVRGAMDRAERDLREIEADVPVRRAGEGAGDETFLDTRQEFAGASLEVKVQAARAEVERLRARAESAERERDALKRIINEDGLECLPGCDEAAHEDNCPYAAPGDAYRSMRARAESAERRLGEALALIKEVRVYGHSGTRHGATANVPEDWNGSAADLLRRAREAERDLREIEADVPVREAGR